jgi:hypothetical protein
LSLAAHGRLLGVNALLTGVIGIAATLLGSFSTYLFQSRTAKRAEAFARDQRLREEQLSACSAFAAALTELKQGVVTLWFQSRKCFHRRRGAADYQAAHVECDRLGARAEAARFRVQLVSADPGLMRLADAAFKVIGAIRRAPDKYELEQCEDHLEAAVSEFIHTAAIRLRATAR